MINTDPTIVIDPHPTDWLNEDRIGYLHDCILPIVPLLVESKLLDKLLLAWFQHEIIREVDPKELPELDERSLVLEWCREKWGHRIESLYLANKDKLDLITYRALTVQSFHLAHELFYRLKENESTFDQLFISYSIGNEKSNSGRFTNVPLNQFPTLMQSAFASMDVGDLHRPVKNGENYAVVQLLSYQRASLNEDSECRLLLLQFSDWQQGMIGAVRRHLISMD